MIEDMIKPFLLLTSNDQTDQFRHLFVSIMPSPPAASVGTTTETGNLVGIVRLFVGVTQQ